MPDIPVIADSKSWLLAVLKRPYRVLLTIFLITLFFGFHLKDLKFQTSIYDLTIEDLPETSEYNAFKKEFGTEEIILVVARAQDIFAKDTFYAIQEIARRLGAVKGVKRVISLPGIRSSMDITGKWSIDDFKAIIEPVGLLKKNLISEDKKASAITLVLDESHEKDHVIDAAEKILNEYRRALNLYQIGMPVVAKALADSTKADFLKLPPLAILAITIMLCLILRDARRVLGALSSVLVVLVWTFGLMALTGTPLSMVTMIVPVLIIAVGTAYCLYILSEHRHAVAREPSSVQAAYRCISQVGFPTFLAVFTTAIGLCSLLVNRIEAIREFAIFSCFGIISMLIIVLTYLPVLMVIFFSRRPHAFKKGKSSSPLINQIVSGITYININHQKILLICFGIIFIISIAGIFRLKVETNPVEFFKKENPISQRFHDIYRDLAGSFPVNVVIDAKEADFFENPLNLKLLDKFQSSLNTLDGIDKTVSFNDYLKLVNYASNRHKDSAYKIPDEAFEVRILTNSFKTMLGEDLLLGFVSRDFSKMNILLRTHLSSSNDFLDAREAIARNIAGIFPGSISWQITGFGIVISQSTKLLTAGQIKSLSLTLAMIFIIMLTLFLSLKVGLISMVPNLFPIAVNFGVMGWSGIPLSNVTSLIAGIAIGLAVDDTIHYLVRYNKEFKKDLDKKRALQDTVFQMGRPMIATTITLALGFSVLLASGFQPTATFGLLIIITMCSALAGDLLILPSLMMHVELVTIWDLIRIKLGRPPDEGILIFQGLSRSQVYYIIMAGGLRRFSQGEIVFRKGEKGDSMYAVVSGELDVVDLQEQYGKTGESAIKRFISRIGVGDIVGEMAMFRSCTRSATVIASTDAELLEINERMLKRLNWLYPPTAQKFFVNLIKILCNRLEFFTSRCLALTHADSVTGLGNRHFLKEALARETKRASRYKVPLAVFMLRLEGVKNSGMGQGYRFCDLVAAETAAMIKKHIRETDYLCRIDDSTFVGVLIHCSAYQASRTCSRIRGLISSHHYQFLGTYNPLSAKITFATFENCQAPPPEAIIDGLRKDIDADGEFSPQSPISDS
jgi:diguanylate cyclase (GGDEF)-like protein